MKVAMGCDHAGFKMKEALLPYVASLGHKVLDLGAATYDPADDYPDAARAVAVAIARKQADRGIVICGSGVGASVAVNKVPGVRGSMCHDVFSAHQGVEDDDANVLTLGERIIGLELAKEVVRAFLSAHFSRAARHERRLEKVRQIELDARTGAFDFPEVKE